VLIVIAACVSASAQSLPTGWAATDIGNVGAAGSSSGSGGSFTVNGAGADIWNTADAFQFAYTTLSGDGSIVSQVTSVEHVADWTKAGVMMRESLSPGSRHALMLVSAAKGLSFQRRTSTNGASASTTIAGTAPEYVKVTRSGNTFTASHSSDGASWTTVGSATISMASTIYVGLAVSSHMAGTLATAAFNSTAVTSSGGSTPTTETLVFFRHAEKPSGGLEQLTCQGLQRALALPDVLTRQFGTPQYAFAPNPLPKVSDPAGSFYYVRPLATIEPTAIKLGLPVNAQYGYSDITGLQTELLGSTYASSTIFISWEHLKLQQLVQNIMNTYGGGATVPAWPSGDYDSLYVVRVTRDGGSTSATFEHDFEGLNNMPAACP
jgi:regulation of enolase protein 1 (concanavalin A-like superfamily)